MKVRSVNKLAVVLALAVLSLSQRETLSDCYTATPGQACCPPDEGPLPMPGGNNCTGKIYSPGGSSLCVDYTYHTYPDCGATECTAQQVAVTYTLYFFTIFHDQLLERDFCVYPITSASGPWPTSQSCSVATVSGVPCGEGCE